jgi:hypothetical protein
MKRLLALAIIFCLLAPFPVKAELKLELDPVEQDLLTERPIPRPGEEPEPAKKGTNWMYILLGVGVLGAAAGGGGGGGNSSSDGSMSFSW